MVPFQTCLVTPDSITVFVDLEFHPLFLYHTKPISNNCYVCGPWEFPHLFIVSVLPHGAFASFHACRSLIVCSMLDLNCNSHIPNLGSILLQSALLLEEPGSRAPAQILLDEGIPDLLSPILQWAKAQQGKECPLSLASPAIQIAAYPGSSYPEEGGFLRTQSVKQPETGLIFKVGFTHT